MYFLSLNYLPQNARMTQSLLFIFYLILFIYIIKKLRFFQETLTFSFLVFVLVLKIIGGAIVAYIYSHYYENGDTFAYMHDSKVIYESLPSSPLIYLQFISGIEIDKSSLTPYFEKLITYDRNPYNKLLIDTFITLRINAFLCLFSFGYYYVQMLFMCFISLVGTMALYKTVIKVSSCNKLLLVTSCFLIPSVVIWGSSVLKEPLMLFFLGLMILSFHKFVLKSRLIHFMKFLFFALLLAAIKPYILLAMLPGLTAWWIHSIRRKSLPFIILSCYIVTYLFLVFISKTNNPYNLFQFLNDQQIIAYKNAIYCHSHSILELIPFAPNPFSIIKHIPDGIILSLTRPYYNENHSILWQLCAIENIGLLFFILLLIIHLDMQKINQQPLALLFIVAGLVILTTVAFTNPVLGTLVRLKMPGILLLCLGLASLTKSRNQKWKNNTLNN